MGYNNINNRAVWGGKMHFLDNIGIEFTSNYLLQGNNLDKIKTAKKSKIKNIGFIIKNDKKDFDIDSIFNSYSDNVIIHLPTISYNLNNLKKINELVQKLCFKNISEVTINTSNLTMEEFEFSNLDEQKAYFSNITTAIATLASNKVIVGIENPIYKGNSSGNFGQDINHLTDIIVFSRKKLMIDFGFNEEDASKYIGLSFNVSNLLKNNNVDEVNKWFSVFNKDIKCIKYSGEKVDELTNVILSNCLKYNIDTKILVNEKCDLEEINDRYIHLVNVVKVFNKDNNLVSKEEIVINENGYADMICLAIIVVTIAIAVLMIYIKFRG